MGQQSNKVQKRRRRLNYVKRKKEASKVSAVTAKPAAKAAAPAKKPVEKAAKPAPAVEKTPAPEKVAEAVAASPAV